ncbi:Myosin type-2 heavy chain 1 [Nowakowskiella sp. JEL0078]|nr:Myosin type-2 heavy chain 1 [Nowakowskiella sp. JEL0078]
MPTAERKEFELGTWSNYHYLNQGGVGTVVNTEDAAEFVQTQNAMSVIGISVTKQWDIFRICVALLHVGNIKIKGESEKAIILDDDPALILASKLLKVDKSEFKKWLIKRQITTGKEKFVKDVTPINGVVNRDSVAKFIYSQLFEWIVTVININLARDDGSARTFIGVLDIFGFVNLTKCSVKILTTYYSFEHFERNSFEQFCIVIVPFKTWEIFFKF